LDRQLRVPGLLFYALGYAMNDVEVFKTAWPKHTDEKLDMGRCYVRFRNLEEIPYDLIGELATKMAPADWIRQHEAARDHR
jgi:hypothetical protein